MYIDSVLTFAVIDVGKYQPSTSHSVETWTMTLSTDDKKRLETDAWMNALIVNAAQALMKKKFPDTAGLTDTALVAAGRTDSTKTSNLV